MERDVAIRLTRPSTEEVSGLELTVRRQRNGRFSVAVVSNTATGSYSFPAKYFNELPEEIGKLLDRIAPKA